MLHLHRKTEYALLALSYVAVGKPDRASSVAEIAEHYHIPQVLLSKVMQSLKKGGYVDSVKGCAGGYVLACDPAEVAFLDLLRDLQEPLHLVGCLDSDRDPCAQFDRCDIRKPMALIEVVMTRALDDVTLADALGVRGAGARVAGRRVATA